MSCDPLGGLVAAPVASVLITQPSAATVATVASLAMIIMRFMCRVSLKVSCRRWDEPLSNTPTESASIRPRARVPVPDHARWVALRHTLEPRRADRIPFDYTP